MKQLPRKTRLKVQAGNFWPGIDYLTCTRAHGIEDNPLYALGKELVLQEAAEGNEVSKWQWKGYQGLRSGSASCAVRDTDALVQISSSVADAAWKECIRLCTGVSRLDLCLTAMLDHAQPGIFRNAFKHRYERSGSRRRAESVRLNACDRTGDSLYFGSIHSNRMGRCYDKGMEARFCEAGNLIRWEVQLRHRASRFAGLQLCAEVQPRLCVISMVCAFFESYGMVLPDVGAGAPLGCGEVARVAEISPDQGALAFLSRVCKPIVTRLMVRGKLGESLEALGLSASQIYYGPTQWMESLERLTESEMVQ